MPIVLRTQFAIVLAVLSLLLSACSKQYIPNTDVEDTEDNRRVIAFCEKYRKAVERRDVATIFPLIYDKYYEDGGNVDASDDLDFAGLRAYLSDGFRRSKAIRYEIRYRRVVWNEEKGRVYVDYTYSASFKILGPEEKDEWRRTVADNRLELVPHGDEFLIAAGL
ncbi:MAG: hypothetical protein MUF54_09270 [Polyangiaceae bacterium]|jgi:hypothetical protein|nr:hypothetical protein [Polyangiaceae bacterium]